MKSCKVAIDNQTVKNIANGTNLYSLLKGLSLADGLCYLEGLKSNQNCDQCYVEVQFNFESQKRMRKACQIEVTEDLKVWTQSERLRNLRRSSFSQLVAYFPKTILVNSAGLIKRLLKLGMFTTHHTDLEQRFDRGDIRPKGLGSGLKFIKDQCIDCGLCLSYETKFSDTPALKGAYDSLGRFDLEVDGAVDKSVSKSLSLVCPTFALTHELAHEVKTPLKLPRAFLAVTEQGPLVAECQDDKLSITPKAWSKSLDNKIYENLLRYSGGEVFTDLIHGQKNSLSPHQICWVIGRGVDDSTIETIRQRVKTYRQRVTSLTSESLSIESHPFCASRDQSVGVIILGPEDRLSPMELKKNYPNTVGVFLSRRSQWSGPSLEDCQDVFWAPIGDYLEFNLDERGPRHISHSLRRLGL